MTSVTLMRRPKRRIVDFAKPLAFALVSALSVSPVYALNSATVLVGEGDTISKLFRDAKVSQGQLMSLFHSSDLARRKLDRVRPGMIISLGKDSSGKLQRLQITDRHDKQTTFIRSENQQTRSQNWDIVDGTATVPSAPAPALAVSTTQSASQTSLLESVMAAELRVITVRARFATVIVAPTLSNSVGDKLVHHGELERKQAVPAVKQSAADKAVKVAAKVMPAGAYLVHHSKLERKQAVPAVKQSTAEKTVKAAAKVMPAGASLVHHSELERKQAVPVVKQSTAEKAVKAAAKVMPVGASLAHHSELTREQSRLPAGAAKASKAKAAPVSSAPKSANDLLASSVRHAEQLMQTARMMTVAIAPISVNFDLSGMHEKVYAAEQRVERARARSWLLSFGPTNSKSVLRVAAKRLRYVQRNRFGGRVHKVLASAKDLIGSPYLWGGTTPNGFDCSGFVVYNLKRVGVKVPRTAHQQFNHTRARAVSRENLRPGDLVFFKDPKNHKRIGHVGIYVGNDQFIHSVKTGIPVKITSMNRAYYRKRFVRGGRVIS